MHSVVPTMPVADLELTSLQHKAILCANTVEVCLKAQPWSVINFPAFPNGFTLLKFFM